MQVDAAALGAALVERQIAIRGEVQHMRNNVEKAYEAVEALAKAVYSNVFDDLVLRINAAVGGERGASIGVLDIFGFEIFESNSLEQLLINYTNEQLQAIFNEIIFNAAQQENLAEGIPADAFDAETVTNQAVLQLFSTPRKGLFSLLNEECIFPKGSDATFTLKLLKEHKDNPRLTRPAYP